MKKIYTSLQMRWLGTLAVLLAFVCGANVNAQNVTISPSSGNMIAGVAGGNTSESGKVAGFYSTWVHEQLALTVNTSDIANLTSAGDIADPACTLTDKTYNGTTAVASDHLILANGNTQTFMVVSLPKGYRFTGYRIVLQPDLNNVKLTTVTNSGSGHGNVPAAGFNPVGEEATCFYETKAWDSDFTYYQNSQQTFETSDYGEPINADGDNEYLAVATASDGDKVMNPDADADKTFTISRFSTAEDGSDMGNRLYFWVGYQESYYAFSINSFEIFFTAEGTFEAEVAPSGTETSTNYVTAPFTTSKTDLGSVTWNDDLGRYIYTYENVRDIKVNMHLYQEDAVSDGEPHASTGYIHPVSVDGEGHFAFGNNTYFVEPPTIYSTPSGINNQPIGFRVVGASFKPLWGNPVTGGTQQINSSCQIYRSTSDGNLTANLDMGQTGGTGSSSSGYTNVAADWKFDEYGNMYIGDGDKKQYLACYGSGNIRQLSLSSTPTGEMATWNLRRDSNGRIYYKSDSNKYYYLYTKTAREGSVYKYRGYLITDGNSYPNSAPSYYSTTNPNSNAYGYTAVTSTTPSTQTITLPSYTPGAYTLKVYDKKGENVVWSKTFNSADDIETETVDGVTSPKSYDIEEAFNNDAIKFEVEVEDGFQAMVDITLKLEALDPYINRMTVVCTDENAVIGEGQTGKLRMTQTFTASDFGVNGGAFHFNIPSECADDDLYITFEDLYSTYGDATYKDGYGNARYSFVTSPYFQAFDNVAGNQTYVQIEDAGYTMTDTTDEGLYDKRYSADIASTTKIYTAVAGDVAFKFNNAEILSTATNQGDNIGTYTEYPFSVEKYLAKTSESFSDGTTGTGGNFKQIKMKASDESQNSGTYYLFTADETRYNIAPTTAWEHRSYAFYRMEITLGTVTYEPQVEFVKIYDQTFNEKQETDAYYGAVVTAPYTEDGVTKQGYASTDKIFEKIEQAITDETVTVKPASAKQLLYLDFSQLAGIFQVTTEQHGSMDDYSGTNAPNCLIFLPTGASAPNNNVAAKTSGGFQAANNIVLTDGEPFYTPYDIQVDGENYVLYDRKVTQRYGGIQEHKASIIMPFEFVVNSDGQYLDPDTQTPMFSLHTMQATGCLSDSPVEDGDVADENEAFVFFPKITPVKTKTEANKPYLLRVLNTPSDETLSFIVRQKGGTVKATTTGMDENYLFAGETATGSSSVATESTVNYTFNAYGGYSGQLLAHNSTSPTYFYFAKNKFVSSNQLLDSYTTIKVLPFRSYYLTTNNTSGVKGLSELGIIFDEGIGNMDATGIKDVQTTKPDLMIEVGKGYMTLTSTADQDVKVYSVSGVNVLNANMLNGESKTVAVPDGIYIVNGAKLIVK